MNRERSKIKDFYLMYQRNCQECRTYQEAYQLTEKWAERNIGHRMYSNYNTFRSSAAQRRRRGGVYGYPFE